MSTLNNAAISLGKIGTRILLNNVSYALFLACSLFIITGLYMIFGMTITIIFVILLTVFMCLSYKVHKKYS